MSSRASHAPALLAPGASSARAYAPGRSSSLPPVDERIVVPETRAEIVDGELLWANPADAPHATRHFDLTYVLGAHVVPGYRGAVDMLTRTSKNNDFAPDASVFPSELDDEGNRQLEELAFEVTSEQALSVPTTKARQLVARGVRRVFAILVKQRRVVEWSRETDGWGTLAADGVIEDRCLCRPLSIASLLDAAEQDNEVARALIAKDNPVLRAVVQAAADRGRGEGERAGEERARREAVLSVCKVFGIVPTDVQRAQLQALDVAGIEALLTRIATARRWDE